MALFEIIQLDNYDSVYVSALTPRNIIKLIMMYGATPVFCDVAPDSLTIDPKSLESAVYRNINDGDLYPRAVIADNFCGMPFAARAVKSVCTRFGLILIEACGENFGGISDGMPCGSVGDYSLISLGGSSAFGAGGNACLLNATGSNTIDENLCGSSCGSIFGNVDEMYGDALLDSTEKFDVVLERSRAAASEIRDILADSDLWIQRGGGRQKSSFGSIGVVTQDEGQCRRLLKSFGESGLSGYVHQIHAHSRSCFERGCRGFKSISNASTLAPRALSVDIFGAIHNSDIDRLIEQFKKIIVAAK